MIKKIKFFLKQGSCESPSLFFSLFLVHCFILGKAKQARGSDFGIPFLFFFVCFLKVSNELDLP